MEQTNFGITVNTDDFPPEVNLRELIARLFAAPNISVEKVKRIINDPTDVRFDLLDEKTSEAISKLFERQKDGVDDLSKSFSGKIAEWTREWGMISEEDIDFIQVKFHLNKDIFLNEIRKCICEAIDSPKGLAEYVNKFIKGQKETLKVLSIPFYNHYLRIKNKINPPKTAVCLVGNTGVGKTESIRRFSSIVDAPVVRVNLASVVPNGIVGNTIAKELASHINCESDVEKYKYSIVHFAEFDKLSSKFSKGLDIQKELLEFFDTDSSINLKRNKDHCDETATRLPVNDLLICFDGAFLGIEDVIEKRLKKMNKLSRQEHPDRDYLMRFLTKDDLIEFGILPELMSRIGKISVMNPLSADMIYKILAYGKGNDIGTHKLYCEQRGFTLDFDGNALHEIARLTLQSGSGVRGIGSILDTIMEDIYFDSTSYKGKTLMVDAPFIEEKLFYNKHGKLIEDYEQKCDIPTLSKIYCIDEGEINDLIITHTIYKNRRKPL